MEKVKIKVAIDSGKKYGEKPIVNIETEDGRKGVAFDAKFLELNGKEAEVLIKEGKEYQGVKQLIFNLQTEKKNGFTGTPKDWTFEKRKSALECATSAHAGGVAADENILKTAENFFTFLNQK